jgi:hypothetical protein
MKQTQKIARGIYKHLATGIEIWNEAYNEDDNKPWKLAGHTDHDLYKREYLWNTSFATKAEAIEYLNDCLNAMVTA